MSLWGKVFPTNVINHVISLFLSFPFCPHVISSPVYLPREIGAKAEG